MHAERRKPHQLECRAILGLEPLTDTQLDYLQWAMIRWTMAFKVNSELSPADLLCPPDLESALIDTINAHRYYLTAKLQCRCLACETARLSAALRTMLDMKSPVIVIVEPSTLPTEKE